MLLVTLEREREREREREGEGEGEGERERERERGYYLLPHVELSGGANPSPEQIELQLVESKQDIEHPPSIKEIELQSSSNNIINGVK